MGVQCRGRGLVADGGRTNNRSHNPSQDKPRVVLQEVVPQVLVALGVDIDP